VTDDDTQNLRRPADLNTDPDENRTKRYGRRMLGAGISISVGTVVAAQTAAIISEQRMFDNRAAELFAILTLVALMSLGFAMITVGGLERIQRPSRRRLRHHAALLDRLRVLAERSAIDHREQYDNLQGLVAALPGRMSALEERTEEMARVLESVPDYSQGLSEGARVAATMLGMDTEKE
jgi:hypothetical protein